MAREIKFRAWNKGRIKGSGFMFFSHYEDGSTDEDIWSDYLSGFHDLMQFTGLKDKNGKDIYEGDIIEWPADGRDKIAVVEFGRRGGFVANWGRGNKPNGLSTFGWQDIYQFGSFYPVDPANPTIKIIGNIHQNQGLVK